MERSIALKMAYLAKDNLWKNDDEVKILTLEHHMAASRIGFLTYPFKIGVYK